MDDGQNYPRCARCGTLYDRALNIGAFACRYHPAPYDPEHDVYACCGLRDEEAMRRVVVYPWPPVYATDALLGCTRCDHDYAPERDGLTVVLPSAAAHALPEAIVATKPTWRGLVHMVLDRFAARGTAVPEAKAYEIVAHVAARLWADVPPDDEARRAHAARIPFVPTRASILRGTPEGNKRLVTDRVLPPAVVVRRAAREPDATMLTHIETVNARTRNVKA